MGDDRPVRYEDDGKIIYRASALGSCISGLAMLGMGMTPQAFPDWLLEKFDQGIAGEPVVLRMLAEREHLGVRLRTLDEHDTGLQYGRWVGGQIEVEIPVGDRIVIRGHLDGIGQVFSRKETAKLQLGDRVLVEVKCVSSGYAKTLWTKLPPIYLVQISLYMHRVKLPCLLALGIKNDDGDVVRVEPVWIPKPPLNVVEIKMRVLDIERRIEYGEYGDCDYRQYPCPFYYTGCQV